MKPRIYIVEDERISSKMLSEIIEDLNYIVVGISSNGEDLLANIDNLQIDIILMDIQLDGDRDGIDIAMDIKKKYDIPIIYITSFSDPETLTRVKRYGCPYGYLLKPYQREELHVTIEIALVRYEANRQLMESEKRYKTLVECTDDIIFHMSEDYIILDINKSVKNHLNIKSSEIVGMSVFDLLYVQSEGFDTLKSLLIEKLKSMENNKKPIQFRIALKHKSFLDIIPYEMSIRLEPILFNNKKGYLGKAFKSVEDPLLKYHHEEKQTLIIENDILIVKDVVERITRNLVRYIEEKTLILIKIALREILFNSIEHGNLNITFEEKTKYMINDSYIKVLSERRKSKEFKDKKVVISYIITQSGVSFSILDEGNGFDYIKLIKELKCKSCEETSEHGRGLSMVLSIFDSVNFNKKGNEITVAKKFNK